MNISVDIKGLEEARRSIERMERNVKAIRGTHEVTISELLTPEFLRKHSRFASVEDLMIAGGFMAKSEALTRERFKAIPDKALDEFVSKETNFPDWKAMIGAAAGEYARRRMLDGI